MPLNSEASVYLSLFIYPDTIHSSPYSLFHTCLWLHLLLSTFRTHTLKTKAFWNVFYSATVITSNVLPFSFSHNDLCKAVSYQFRENKKDDEEMA